jgi:hypothetical protein
MRIIIAAAALLLATGAPSYAQNADITGKWDLTVTTSQGPMPTSAMVLKKDGEKIVGTISGPQGDISVEAEIKEKAVSIWASVPTQQGPIDVTFSGAVDGNTMKGTVDFGGRGGGDWSARRADTQPAPATPAPAAQDKIDVSGTWAFEVTTDFGTGNSTMVFKQDGEKLTGQYSGTYGEAALTGTVKGKDITFSYDLVRETVTVHVVYAGVVEKDTMKGTLSLGDMGNGSFTGKKTK